jgi:hypothetical protein
LQEKSFPTQLNRIGPAALEKNVYFVLPSSFLTLKGVKASTATKRAGAKQTNKNLQVP